MNPRCTLVVIVFFTKSLYGQFDFKSLRYNEDYSYLKNDTSRTWYEKMKYYSCSNNEKFFISSGGEVRYQFQHFTNEDWGAGPVQSYNSYYTRFLFHSDFHMGNKVRLFYQLNSTFAVGRVTPIRMIDQNELDLHQTFIDWKPRKEINVRMGRQEFLYGAQRIISVREGPNNRQSFDALKFIYKKVNTQWDAYYARPVRIQLGLFNDGINNLEQIWSVNFSRNRIKYFHNADLYYIGFQSDMKAYDRGAAEELRHSIGIRIWNKSDKLNYDFEALYQFGEWGVQQIQSYTASIDVNYLFNKRDKRPQFGLKSEFISGDRNGGDNELNSFNPLYPRGAYFGLAALIGPVNLIDVHPYFSVMLTPRLKLSADYDAFWRYSINDGIYGPNVMLTFDSRSTQRFIGNQVGCALDWQPNSFLTVNPEGMYFFAGPYISDVSAGKDVFFAAITVQFKY